MKKEEYNATVLMTAKLLGLQAEVNYLQMFEMQGERYKELDDFIKKIAKLSGCNKGARIAKSLIERWFMLSAKQAYFLSKTAIRHQIQL